jgi:hypothetical protein
MKEIYKEFKELTRRSYDMRLTTWGTERTAYLFKILKENCGCKNCSCYAENVCGRRNEESICYALMWDEYYCSDADGMYSLFDRNEKEYSKDIEMVEWWWED